MAFWQVRAEFGVLSLTIASHEDRERSVALLRGYKSCCVEVTQVICSLFTTNSHTHTRTHTYTHTHTHTHTHTCTCAYDIIEYILRWHRAPAGCYCSSRDTPWSPPFYFTSTTPPISLCNPLTQACPLQQGTASSPSVPPSKIGE